MEEQNIEPAGVGEALLPVSVGHTEPTTPEESKGKFFPLLSYSVIVCDTVTVTLFISYCETTLHALQSCIAL